MTEDSQRPNVYLTVSFTMPSDQRMTFSGKERCLQEEDFIHFIPFNPSRTLLSKYYYCHLTGDKTETQIT